MISYFKIGTESIKINDHGRTATVLEPYIDSQGYFHGILFDKYDFSWVEFYKSIDYDDIIAYIANDYFFIIQLLKGHNYYILVPILFKW